MFVENTYYTTEQLVNLTFSKLFNHIKFKLVSTRNTNDQGDVEQTEIVELNLSSYKNELVIPFEKETVKIIVVVLKFNNTDCEYYYTVNTKDAKNTVNTKDHDSENLNELPQSLDIEQFGSGLIKLMQLGM
jgi:hypothetical protein